MDDPTRYPQINETVRLQFEEGWLSGEPQPIEALLHDSNAPNYLTTLEELVHIEMEFRWKNRDPLKLVKLEEYLERFELLKHPDIVNRLIQQEVSCRIGIGETPVPEEYQQRFPGVHVEIPALPEETGRAEPSQQDTDPDSPTLMPSAREAGADPYGATIGTSKTSLDDRGGESDAVPGYELLGELGRGGMGVVYQARDTKLKRTVALKMILSGAHASDEDMERFQIEAEAVARLQHPNIVQIFEVSEHNGNPYIALEFADGGSLADQIAGNPQDEQEAARLIETLSGAMQLAHENEIIHRDLKPANILLTADGQPRITDFGLAKRMDQDSKQTKTGAVMGTPSYMAPEQAGGQAETLGPATDTYALGAILYCLLTGRPPFQAATPFDTIVQVMAEEPVAPRKLNSSVSVDLETICLKCLEKSVHRRYESAAALGEDLRRFLADEPILARPVSVAERSWKWARRRPALAGMIGVSALALVVLMAGGLWYNRQLEDSLALAEERRQEAQENRALAETKNAELGAANKEISRQATAALHAEYVATVNLVDQDAKAIRFRSAKKRIDRFNGRITRSSSDPRGIEWQQLSRVVDNFFTELKEPASHRIRSFAVSELADVVLYNVDNPDLDHSNQLRLYDAVERKYLSSEPITIPQIEVDTPNGLILHWVSGRTFVLGNHLGLFALTVKHGVNETTAEDIKTLDAGVVCGISATHRPGEFMVAYLPSEEAAQPRLHTRIWQLNQDASGVSFTPGEQTESLASGEYGDMEVQAFEVSPDGRWMAVARGEFLEIRNLPNGELLSTIQAQSNANSPNAVINDVAWIETNEGVSVAIAGNNKMVELFLVAQDGTRLMTKRVLQGHASFIQRLAYDPGTGWLLTASNDQSIYCWSPLSGERIFVLDEHDLEVIDISFANRGQFILSASFDGRLIIRKRVTDDRWRPAEPDQISGNHWSTFCVLPGGDRILLGGGQSGARGLGSLSLIDVNTHRVLDVVTLEAMAQRGIAHPDKSFALIPLVNGDVVRCDIRDDQLEVTPVVFDFPKSWDPEKDKRFAHRIIYAPAGQRFYVGLKVGTDSIGRGAVGVIDEDGQIGKVYETGVERGIYSMAISPAGDLLAVGTFGSLLSRPQLCIFQIGEEKEHLGPARLFQTDFPSLIYDLVFHPDGNSLFVAGNHKNILRLTFAPPALADEQDFQSIDMETLYGHFHSVARVMISNSDRRLISFGLDGLVCVWDLQSGQLLTKREFSGLKMSDMAKDLESDRLLLLIDDQIVDP